MAARLPSSAPHLALALLLVAAGCDDATTAIADGSTATPDAADTTLGGGDAPLADAPLADASGPAPDAPPTDAESDGADEGDLVDVGGGDAATDTAPEADADAATDVGPPPEPGPCPDGVDCDDGLPCTEDLCDPVLGHCVWQLAPGGCLIANVCRDAGATKPGSPCLGCWPGADAFGWTATGDGAPCDDGDPCTQAVCDGDDCAASALPCDDGDPCTADGCDPVEGGCVHTPVSPGSPCEDGDACTVDDGCAALGCTGTPLDCDDGEACTEDGCDPALGCTSVDIAAPCEDGDLCTTGDTCVDGACAAGGPANCDDGDFCTADTCLALVGCTHLPQQSACCTEEGITCPGDGNPCTSAACDPVSGACTTLSNAAPCDDGDACTTGDVCAGGACTATPVTCDDGNPCTADACDPGVGCFFTDVPTGPCDDGVACTVGDSCVAGACVGDESGCVCTPTFSDDAVKVVVAGIGDGGYPGEALDVDLDATTCSPSLDCEAGLDNALSDFGSIANPQLVGALDAGDLILLVEFIGLGDGDSTFEMALHQGQLDPSNASCDITGETCAYLADPSTLDEDTCQPLVKLPATLTGTTIVAGGTGVNFPFSIPLTDTIQLSIVLYNVRFEGTVTLAGGQAVALDGVLGGAVPKASLLAAIDVLPDDALPVPKAAIAGILESLVENDIDTTGDGSADAASIGLTLQAIDATITGLSD